MGRGTAARVAISDITERLNLNMPEFVAICAQDIFSLDDFAPSLTSTESAIKTISYLRYDTILRAIANLSANTYVGLIHPYQQSLSLGLSPHTYDLPEWDLIQLLPFHNCCVIDDRTRGLYRTWSERSSTISIQQITRRITNSSMGCLTVYYIQILDATLTENDLPFFLGHMQSLQRFQRV